MDDTRRTKSILDEIDAKEYLNAEDSDITPAKSSNNSTSIAADKTRLNLLSIQTGGDREIELGNTSRNAPDLQTSERHGLMTQTIDQAAAVNDGQDDEKQEQLLQDIKQAHENNQLNGNNQKPNSKELLAKMEFLVPLDKLYKVHSSCTYNVMNKYCPILLEIVDVTCLQKNGGKHFLLQVWDDQGQMLFERALKQPVSNWNISDEMFMYQEQATDSNIWLVKLKSNNVPKIYKIELPQHVVDDPKRVNSFWDFKRKKLVVPIDVEEPLDHVEVEDEQGPINNMWRSIIKCQQEDGMNSEAEFQTEKEQFDEMHLRGELKGLKESSKVSPEVYEKSEKSVTEIMGGDIIKRAPDKMLQIQGNFLILAWRNDLIIINLKPLGILDDTDVTSNFKLVTLQNSQMQFLKLSSKYKIITLQDIDCDEETAQTAIVLEELKSRLIRYLKIDYLDADDGRSIKLSQLGVMVTRSKLVVSPLLKYRAISRQTDDEIKMNYHVGIVVRENGRWEVYSDFMLVYDYYDKVQQCIDVETDFNQFYLKFVKNAHLIKENNKPVDFKHQTKGDVDEKTNDYWEIKVRQVRHHWRSRICYDTAKRNKDPKVWDIILHRRIANYFKMYSQIMNFQLFMLVSHRDMISVYEMYGEVNKSWKTFHLPQGNIRQMFIKKRPFNDIAALSVDYKNTQQDSSQAASFYEQSKVISVFETYQIVALQGINTVSYFNLNDHGVLTSCDKTRTMVQSAISNRILRFKNDEFDKYGIFILTDDKLAVSIEAEYKVVEECSLFTFPFKTDDSDSVAKYTLSTIKQGKVFELLKSQDCDNMNADSFFRTIKSNKTNFVPQKDYLNKADDDDVTDEVLRTFKKKDEIYALVITSVQKYESSIYPIYSVKDENTKEVKAIKLINNKVNVKEIEVDKSEEDNRPVHAFQVFRDEFGEECNNNYVQISEKQIKVYDADFKEKYTFRGLNIRNCQDISQAYLYSNSDRITDQFEISHELKGDDDKRKKSHKSPSGLFVYDISKLLQGTIEKYKLAKSIGGVCNHIDNSIFSARFSFLQDYNNIVMLPHPHLNTINFIGMGQKHEYSLWRQKNGFFTVLDRRGELLTWSMLSGKLLYKEPQPKDSYSVSALKGYDVYRSDEDDITYTRNFYNHRERSIQLLYSPSPFGGSTDHKKAFVREALAANFKRLIGKQGKVNTQHDVKPLDPTFIKPNPPCQVTVCDTSQDPKLHHFKVMELKTHEDTKNGSQVKLLFHFTFPKIYNHPNVSDHSKNSWDINTNPRQRLYLSQDTTLLMEVINNFIGTVYKRINVDELNRLIPGSENDKDTGQLVRWKPKYRIKSYPEALGSMTSVPFLFSPNFKYQLDFNFRKERFVIREVDGQKLYMNIPKDLLKTQWRGQSGWKAIKIIVSRFQWVTEKVIRFVNESNLDCLLEIVPNEAAKSSDKNADKLQFKLLSAVKIDNLFENMHEIDSMHLIWDREPQETRDVLERLIRMNQHYKTELLHAQNVGKDQMVVKLNKEFNILHQINNIDYLQVWGDKRSNFDIELSYSILNWLICEQIIFDKNFFVKSVESEQRAELCFNIFPKGSSLIHMFSMQTMNSDNESKVSDFFQGIQSASQMFEICMEHPDFDLLGSHHDGCLSKALELPILPNIYGLTCLDYCLPGKVPDYHYNDGLYVKNNTELATLGISENIRLAELIYEGISDYGFMHSSPFVTASLLDAIKIGESFASNYLAKSLKKVDHFFKQTTQYELRPEKLFGSQQYEEYGMTETSVFCPENLVKKELFIQNGTLQPMNLQFIDVQHVFKNQEIGHDFIEALEKCQEMEFFSNPAIQMIIDYQWAYWYKRSLLLLGAPLTLQLLLFMLYSNIILPHNDDENFDTFKMVIINTIIVTNIYALLLELPMMYQRKCQWFSAAQNLINFASNVLQLYNAFTADTESKLFWRIQTVVAILIWWRFVLYLRTFESFSWMVRLIQQSIQDMSTFLALFFFIVLSFADAFLSIQKLIDIEKGSTGDAVQVHVEHEHAADQSWYDEYFTEYVGAIRMSYASSLGEFNEVFFEDYNDLEWLIFFMSTIINVIVLLNSLIAITGDTFTTIFDEKVPKGYQEKVLQMQILQTGFSFFMQKKDSNSRLFIARQIVNSNMTQHGHRKTMDALSISEEFADMKAEFIGLEERVIAAQEANLKTLFEQFMENSKAQVDPKNARRRNGVQGNALELAKKMSQVRATPNNHKSKVAHILSQEDKRRS